MGACLNANNKSCWGYQTSWEYKICCYSMSNTTRTCLYQIILKGLQCVHEVLTVSCMMFNMLTSILSVFSTSRSIWYKFAGQIYRHTDYIYSLAMSQDGCFLACGGEPVIFWATSTWLTMDRPWWCPSVECCKPWTDTSSGPQFSPMRSCVLCPLDYVLPRFFRFAVFWNWPGISGYLGNECKQL